MVTVLMEERILGSASSEGGVNVSFCQFPN